MSFVRSTLKSKFNAAVGVLAMCALVVCISHAPGITLAQTMSAPVTVSSSMYGQKFYIYSPSSGSIISPVQYTNSLTMVPWQSYNTTMQWSLQLDAATGIIVFVNSASSPEAGCNSGTARWNAGKNVALTTLCTPATSLYTFYEFSSTGQKGYYYIIPTSNAAACVSVENGVPFIPPYACTYLANTQWQLVTISP